MKPENGTFGEESGSNSWKSPEVRNFGELLKWHVEVNGTRANGPRAAWHIPDFCLAVGKGIKGRGAYTKKAYDLLVTGKSKKPQPGTLIGMRNALFQTDTYEDRKFVRFAKAIGGQIDPDTIGLSSSTPSDDPGGDASFGSEPPGKDKKTAGGTRMHTVSDPRPRFPRLADFSISGSQGSSDDFLLFLSMMFGLTQVELPDGTTAMLGTSKVAVHLTSDGYTQSEQFNADRALPHCEALARMWIFSASDNASALRGAQPSLKESDPLVRLKRAVTAEPKPPSIKVYIPDPTCLHLDLRDKPEETDRAYEAVLEAFLKLCPPDTAWGFDLGDATFVWEEAR